MNSDVDAACGGLCAGNPFDSAYPIMPLDRGENHEMGHNLQRGRLKIHGGRSNEVSNNLFPIHVKWQWARDQGLDTHPLARRGDHVNAFAQFRAALLDGDPADINHRIWTGSGTYDNNGVRLALYEQFAFAHGDWSMWTKLYVLERIFTNAIREDARWASVQAAIGFSNYTRSDASIINGNDFMLIAASMIEGRDYSDFFELWGVDTSEVAHAQVVANGQNIIVPPLMYYVRDALDVAFPTDEDLIDPGVASEWADP